MVPGRQELVEEQRIGHGRLLHLNPSSGPLAPVAATGGGSRPAAAGPQLGLKGGCRHRRLTGWGEAARP